MAWSFLGSKSWPASQFWPRVGSRSAKLSGWQRDLCGSETRSALIGRDGSYSRMSWHHPPGEARITLEWSRADANTVVGRLSAAATVQLVLEAYLPHTGASPEGVFSVSEADRSILGECYFDRTFDSTLKFLIITDRPLISAGTYGSLEGLRNSMRASGRLNSAGEPTPGVAGIEFLTDVSRTAHFVATLGPEEAELAELGHMNGWLPARLMHSSPGTARATQGRGPESADYSRALPKPSATRCLGIPFTRRPRTWYFRASAGRGRTTSAAGCSANGTASLEHC